MNDKVFVGSRRSPVERARILADYRASGSTQREFAARAGISLSCLSIWLRGEKRRPRSTVSASPASSARPVAFVEVAGMPAPQPPISRHGSYTLHLPGGLSLEMPRGFSACEARELLQLVREL